MRRLWITLLAMAAIAPALTGCKGGTIPIKTLLDDPARFDRQSVRIAGEVRQSIGVLGYGAFRLDDGTGVLTVVTKEGGAPRQGARVQVEGEFRSGFTLGTESVAVVIEKQRYGP